MLIWSMQTFYKYFLCRITVCELTFFFKLFSKKFHHTTLRFDSDKTRHISHITGRACTHLPRSLQNYVLIQF